MTLTLTPIKHGTLTHFLPFDPEQPLKSTLRLQHCFSLLHCVCLYIVNGIDYFYQKQYQHFDAQVSESLCQIRAVQLQFLARQQNALRHQQIPSQLASRALHLLPLIEAALRRPLQPFIDQQVSLNDILKQCHIHLDIPETAIWLTELHLLTDFKKYQSHHRPTAIDYDTAKEITCVDSKTVLKRFIHKMQRHVTAISMRFMFDKAQLIDNNAPALLKSLWRQDEIGRHVLPAFEVTRCLFDIAKQHRQPLGIIVTRSNNHGDNDEIAMFFNKSTLAHYNNAMVVVHARADYADKPLDNKEQYIERFMQYGLENCVLWNMAQHPQYTGTALTQYKNNPYDAHDGHALSQYQQFRQFASITGCSQDNPSLFLISHIYAENFAHVAHLETSISAPLAEEQHA